MDEATLKMGDDPLHGETAYAIRTEGEMSLLLASNDKTARQTGRFPALNGTAKRNAVPTLVPCLCFLPMTSAASPISAAAEQQHQNNDNENQFHGVSSSE